MEKKKRHIGRYIAIGIVLIIVIAAVIVALKARSEINALKGEAETLKQELQGAVSSVQNLSAEDTEAAVEKLNAIGEQMSEQLNDPFWTMIGKVPEYGEDVETAKYLLEVLSEADGGIFQPLISLMKEYPIEELKQTEEGLNIGIILAYLDFLDETGPKIHSLVDKIDGISFHSVDLDIASYTNKIVKVLDALESLDDHKQFLRTFLGNGKDRLYLVMAQNTAEIRASGGFPGSMGLIRIKDGILSIGDFSSVLNYLKMSNQPEAEITQRETELFQYMYTRWSHDACYNPHFKRVAEITRAAYEFRNGEKLDGIMAMTPEIIQKVLKLTGDTITLEDGSVLTGEDATKVLQRDLYYKYQGDNATAYDNNNIMDSLFAETAKSAIGSMFRNMDIEKLPAYMDFLNECSKNRTMLLWFADEEEEKIPEKYHISGNLNSDPKNPVAGVYFSCCDPGKLGMFTTIIANASSPKYGMYGIKEYTVRVTFNNYIDVEDVSDINSSYILGNNAKAIQGYAYFFAPAGGNISDFSVTNGMTVNKSDYAGLQLGYVLNLFLYPGKPVTFTYKVTTAPGKTAPLTFDVTPTLQNYR